ncbi:hypothetical protein [Catellatospora sp. NPDC049133]|uniref:hypothetical protein n=1 Tax=Catellatospora sp. NPDC049133 TaxID=3155499 RepID=UPI0033D64E48
MDTWHVQGGMFGNFNRQFNVYPSARPARSAYLHQVRRIASPTLEGRQAELDELTEFCLAAGDGGYMCWFGPAWAGKTALMSWFVLHSPEQTEVVSFFITASMPGQNDRAAFAEVLIVQLAALLGQPVPTLLTPATRESHFLDLLEQAATACRERGKRLVLVVDGLDEDCGVTAEYDAYSIAALLPADPPAGLRVIVTSRPHPPIPVEAEHPLRQQESIRKLTVSPVAQIVRTDARRELKRLLRGETIGQDLLGLLVAAGGGLSATDLAELAKVRISEIDEKLGTVAGRTFQSRTSFLRASRPDVFVLAHEELLQIAAAFFGTERLMRYTESLMTWANSYRERSWPTTTPDYLLSGYFVLLRGHDDLAAMIELAVDRKRQDRMVAVTASDAGALTEIGICLSASATRHDLDLAAIVRLAMHRDHLNGRNAVVPEGLPELWMRLGYPERGAALLQTMFASAGYGDAATRFVETAVESGQEPWICEWLRAPWSIQPEQYQLDERQALQATFHMKKGELRRAEQVAGSIADAEMRSHLISRLRAIEATADDSGLQDTLSASTVDSEAPASDPARWVLLPPEPDEHEAVGLWREPVCARDIEATEQALRWVRAGRWDKAEAVVSRIRDRRQRGRTVLGAIAVCLVAGDRGRVDSILGAFGAPFEGTVFDRESWNMCATALSTGTAIELFPDETLALVGGTIIEELAHRDEPRRAEEFAGCFDDRDLRARLLVRFAATAFAAGRPAQAEQFAFAAAHLARDADVVEWLADLSREVVDLLADTGHRQRAKDVITQTMLRLGTRSDHDGGYGVTELTLLATVADDEEVLPLLRRAAEVAETDEWGPLEVAEAAIHRGLHAFARKLAGLLDDGQLAELAITALLGDLPDIAADCWGKIKSKEARTWAMTRAAVRCVVGGRIELAKFVAIATRETVDSDGLAGIDCMLALCEYDDQRAEELLTSVPAGSIVATAVTAELAARWTAKGDIARADSLARADPDIHVAGKIIEALVVRGEAQAAFERTLSLQPKDIFSTSYSIQAILCHVARVCQPTDARRFLATAVHYGRWAPVARAAAALEPSLAILVADEYETIRGSDPTRSDRPPSREV